MEKILTVKNLEKSFKTKKVLHGISFDVHKGEIMALLGPNGAGKSTTIRSMMEILYPDNGFIHFHLEKSGKIKRNKIGIQKYGKNATPKEIWRWLWTS